MRACAATARSAPELGHSPCRGNLLQAHLSELRASLSDTDLRRCQPELADTPSTGSTCRRANEASGSTTPAIGSHSAKTSSQFLTPDPKSSKGKGLQSPSSTVNSWPKMRRFYMDTLRLSSAENSSQALAIGQEVQCRDEGDRSWMRGVVTAVDPVIKVLPRGWHQAFSFDMVRSGCEADPASYITSPEKNVTDSDVKQSMTEKLSSIRELTAESMRLQTKLLDVEKDIGHITVLMRLEGRGQVDIAARVKATAQRLASIEEIVTSRIPIKHSGCSILYGGLLDRCKLAETRIDELCDCIHQAKFGTTSRALFKNFQASWWRVLNGFHPMVYKKKSEHTGEVGEIHEGRVLGTRDGDWIRLSDGSGYCLIRTGDCVFFEELESWEASDITTTPAAKQPKQVSDSTTTPTAKKAKQVKDLQVHFEGYDVKCDIAHEVQSNRMEPQAEPSPCQTKPERESLEYFIPLQATDALVVESHPPKPVLTIREVWQTAYVDKHVFVPEILVEEKVVEVPHCLVVERAQEVEYNETVHLRKERVVEERDHIPKAVPLVNLQPVHRFEEVTLELQKEFVKEKPHVKSIEIVTETAEICEEVRQKEVPKTVFNFFHEEERVPAITRKEEIVEVIKQDTLEIIKEVPVNALETVDRKIVRPICEIAEIVEEVDMVEVHERIVSETPEKVVIEHIKEIPHFVTETIEIKVAKPIYEYVEVIEEVPVVVYEEEIIEVPEIRRQQIIREVPIPVVNHVDRKIPKHEISIQEKILEYPLILKNEVGIEVPETRYVELVSSEPRVKVEEIRREQPKVTICPQEVYEEVPLRLICETPNRVIKTHHCDVVTQLPVKVVQQREKVVSNPLPVPSERIDWIPVETSEEVVEIVPGIQAVEAVHEELQPIVSKEVRRIPHVQMKYTPVTVEVGYLDQAEKIKSCGISGSDHVLHRRTGKLVSLRDSRSMQDAYAQDVLLQQNSKRSLSRERFFHRSVDPIVYKNSTSGNFILSDADVKEPANSVTIGFKSQDGSIKNICFNQKPLGITFEEKEPVIVARLVAGGEGQLKNVREGWEVCAICGQSTDGQTYHQILQMLEEAITQLPLKDGAPANLSGQRGVFVSKDDRSASPSRTHPAFGRQAHTSLSSSRSTPTVVTQSQRSPSPSRRIASENSFRMQSGDRVRVTLSR